MARDVDPAARGGEWNGQPVYPKVRRQGHLVHPRRLAAPGEILACSGKFRRMSIFRIPVQGPCSCSPSCLWPPLREDTVLFQEEIRSLRPVHRSDAA